MRRRHSPTSWTSCARIPRSTRWQSSDVERVARVHGGRVLPRRLDDLLAGRPSRSSTCASSARAPSRSCSPDRVLDLLGRASCSATASMLSGLPPGFAARAQEDTLCYRIPEEVGPRHPGASGERRVRRALAAGDACAGADRARRTEAPRPTRANQPVAALIRDPPLLCSPATSIRDAAATDDRRAPATSIVIELGDSLGILTDRDLRSRVVAGGLPYDAPVVRGDERARLHGRAGTPRRRCAARDARPGHPPLPRRHRGPRGHRRRGGDRPARRRDAVLVQPARADRRARARSRSSPAPPPALRPAVIAQHEARVAATSIATMYSVAAGRADTPADRARAHGRRRAAGRVLMARTRKPVSARGRRPARMRTARSSGTATSPSRASGRFCTRSPRPSPQAFASAAIRDRLRTARQRRTCCSCARWSHGRGWPGAGSRIRRRSRR